MMIDAKHYSADPPDMAEVVFTVEEDYQGLGIAIDISQLCCGVVH